MPSFWMITDPPFPRKCPINDFFSAFTIHCRSQERSLTSFSQRELQRNYTLKKRIFQRIRLEFTIPILVFGCASNIDDTRHIGLQNIDNLFELWVVGH